MKNLFAALTVALFTTPALAQDKVCENLKGGEHAACLEQVRAGVAEKQGVGALGKGKGAEHGKGIAKQAADGANDDAKGMAKEKAKEKAKDKSKDMDKDEIREKAEKAAKDKVKEKAKGNAGG